jgi:hypothetical protein
MANSKAKLESSGVKASPCFRPFWIRKLSDKCVPVRTLLYFSFKDNSNNINLFVLAHRHIIIKNRDVDGNAIIGVFSTRICQFHLVHWKLREKKQSGPNPHLV